MRSGSGARRPELPVRTTEAVCWVKRRGIVLRAQGGPLSKKVGLHRMYIGQVRSDPAPARLGWPAGLAGHGRRIELGALVSKLEDAFHRSGIGLWCAVPTVVAGRLAPG